MFFIPGDTGSSERNNQQQPGEASPRLDSSTIRILQLELRSLQSKPMEGFTISCDENNISAWTVGIFGPPGTPYQGGYFKAVISFPSNYPFSPPKFRFTTPVWHPNIYPSGDVCISTLHSAASAATSEAWSPTQNVRTVLLSIISLLNEPNPLSAANPTASTMYDKYKKLGDQEYVEKIRQQVKESKILAKQENVVVPETVDDYVVPTTPTTKDVVEVVDVDDIDGSTEPSEEEDDDIN